MMPVDANTPKQSVKATGHRAWWIAPHQRWLLISAATAALMVGVMFHPRFDPGRIQSFLISASWPLFWTLGVLFWALRCSAGQFSLKTIFVCTSVLAAALAVGRAVHPASGAALVGGLLAIAMVRESWNQRRAVLRPHDQWELGLIGAAATTLFVHCVRVSLAVFQAQG